jgi:hypothetical protein
MRYPSWAPILAGAFLLATLAPSAAQSVTSIHGRVVDCLSAYARDGAFEANRARPVSATVTLADDHGSRQTVATDADGRFSILAALYAGGRVTVAARHYNERVVSFALGDGDSVDLNVFLDRPYSVVGAGSQDRWPARCIAASKPRIDLSTTDRYILR